MSRKLLISLTCIVLAAGIIYKQRADIAVTLVNRAAETRMAVDITDSLEDGLHVFLCGAGGPLPDPKRSGPCVAVVAGKTLVLVDAGSGGSRNLTSMQLPNGRMAALFLTHFHSDHIDGLGEMAMMRWVNGANTSPLPVIGPSGVETVVAGFNQAYGADAQYRNEHHSDLVAPLSGKGMTAQPFNTPAAGGKLVVFEQDGLSVTAFSVDHAPVSPAVGYRFDYKGRSVLVSGDTAKSQNLQLMAQDVDVLVHEALAPNLVGAMNAAAKKNNAVILEKITHDILDYHASPAEAAGIAQAADAKQLLFYHVVPPLIVPGMEAAFLEGVDEAYDGPVAVGVDGTFISLPANSDVIEIGNAL